MISWSFTWSKSLIKQNTFRSFSASCDNFTWSFTWSFNRSTELQDILTRVPFQKFSFAKYYFLTYRLRYPYIFIFNIPLLVIPSMILVYTSQQISNANILCYHFGILRKLNTVAFSITISNTSFIVCWY